MKKTKEHYVRVEDVLRIQKERSTINRLNFHDIRWTRRGRELHIPEEVKNNFPLTGLNNMDFILTGEYRRNVAWLEYCKECGHKHRVKNKKCPVCQVHEVPQPVSENVASKCRHDYACDGCVAYRDHEK